MALPSATGPYDRPPALRFTHAPPRQFGMWNEPRSTIDVAGVMSPLRSPASAVTSLNVEPGAYTPCVARLFSGLITPATSIVDRGSKTNVGELMLQYGGGGHDAAGTCQVENDDAARVLTELVHKINADG